MKTNFFKKIITDHQPSICNDKNTNESKLLAPPNTPTSPRYTISRDGLPNLAEAWSTLFNRMENFEDYNEENLEKFMEPIPITLSLGKKEI